MRLMPTGLRVSGAFFGAANLGAMITIAPTSHAPAIGVDLGGTKIEAIVLDADGRSRWRERVPTPAGDYQIGRAHV